uniref:Uncharacterized protein n=1 Tax=Setaria viridis TaxID=4556 RepID=A0A4U6TUL1_SETVI|nr:hypothetical protein SEVIR_7G202600v2 [Setaria viridis]
MGGHCLCPFALQVWQLVSNWATDRVVLPMPNASIQDWWSSSLTAIAKEKRRKEAGILIYTAWNLWKERNRRVFEGNRSNPWQVFYLIKEEIRKRHMACGARVN